VKLQNDPGCERDVGMIAVDGIEHIPITGDLLLRTISRCRFPGHQFSNSSEGCGDTFQPVGGFRALNDRRLPQGFKNLRRLLFLQILSPLILPNSANGLQQVMGNRLFQDVFPIERSHLCACIKFNFRLSTIHHLFKGPIPETVFNGARGIFPDGFQTSKEGGWTFALLDKPVVPLCPALPYYAPSLSLAIVF